MRRMRSVENITFLGVSDFCNVFAMNPGKYFYFSIQNKIKIDEYCTSIFLDALKFVSLVFFTISINRKSSTQRSSWRRKKHIKEMGSWEISTSFTIVERLWQVGFSFLNQWKIRTRYKLLSVNHMWISFIPDNDKRQVLSIGGR